MNEATDEPGEELNGEDVGRALLRSKTGDMDATMKEDAESEDIDEANDETGTDTNTSDEGKSSSNSGSGGGYSADCSASDQSSDTEGKSRPAGDSGNASLPLNQLDQLGIRDDNHVSAASSTNQNKHSSGKAKSRRGSHSKKDPEKRSRKWEGEGKDDSMEKDGTDMSNLGLPLKSPDHIDIDAIVKAKEQQDRENASFFTTEQVAGLPQWNGVRVGNPMDPRIDLSSVSVVPGGMSFLATQPVAAAFAAAASRISNNQGLSTKPPPQGIDGKSHARPQQQTNQQELSRDAGAPSIDSYVQLMEMVRPFFVSYGVPHSNPSLAQTQQQQEEDRNQHQPSSSDNKDSSEGFTSFFTTTHSSQQSGSSSENGPKKNPKQQSRQEDSKEENKEDINDDGEQDETNKSDSSSMVVLARVKSKHKRGEEDSGERRVRIQEGGKGDAEDEDESSGSSADQKPKAKPRVAPAPEVGAAGGAPDGDESPESSSSSSSATVQEAQRANAVGDAARPHHHHNHGAVPPRIVTDVSSAARTDSTGPSTSSGSGGNTGSGSNQGTSSGSGSGSGNDKGSSEEGKGSSEEKGGSASEEAAIREDNSGESPEGGSDQSDSKNQRVAAKAEQLHHHPPPHNGNEPSQGTGGAVDSGVVDSIEAKQKQKLANKKRKRIEMRREYEAQQHMESTDSSDQKPEPMLKPGRPVSMVDVLQFSKIARVVIQAPPPFHVVHANAAFTRLTGVDSHKVVGKPIGSVLSLPNDGSGSHGPNMGENSSSASGNPQASDEGPRVYPPPNHDLERGHQYRRESIERLVAASGFGRLLSVQVVARFNQLVGKSVSFRTEQSSLAPPVSSRGREGVLAAGSEEVSPAAMDQRQHMASKNANDPSFSSGTNSNNVATRLLFCRASIAPIVSALDLAAASSTYASSISGVEEESEAKRRKHSPGEHSGLARRASAASMEENDSKRRKTQSSMDPPSRRNREQQQKHQLVTHYVIQLETEQTGGNRKFGSLGSLSSHSTSVEVHLTGLSKAKIRHQRAVTSAPNNESTATAGAEDGGGSDEPESESTDPKDHIAAVG